MDNKYRGIDEIIRQAMDQGAFENLSGKGKPLNLDENPYLDKEWQLAYHLLKQNGFAPDFVEKRQAIELHLAEARQALMRTWAWRAKSLKSGDNVDWVEREWTRAVNTFSARVEDLNKEILNYNLNVTSPFLSRGLLNVEDEIMKAKS